MCESLPFCLCACACVARMHVWVFVACVGTKLTPGIFLSYLPLHFLRQGPWPNPELMDSGWSSEWASFSPLLPHLASCYVGADDLKFRPLACGLYTEPLPQLSFLTVKERQNLLVGCLCELRYDSAQLHSKC